MTAVASAACAHARAAEYPHLSGIYLNAASYGPLPARTLAAVAAYEQRRAAAASVNPDDFADVLARARSACARLVHADPAEIVLTPNTTAGLHIAAAMVRASARADRRTVVLPDREFPANVYPWLALERAGDVRVEMVPAADGCPDVGAIIARIAVGDVVALAISAVQFATGYRADLERLGRACRAHGALFVVDGIQAVGAAPVDVRAAGVDVLACGGQKWLCAPYGSGFAYVRRELLRSHEPELPGWMSHTATADYTQLLSYDTELFDDGRRFEVGTLATQCFLGLAHSAELLLEIGVDAILQHARALHAPVLDWAARTGVAVAGRPAAAHGSCIVAVRVPDAARLHRTLEAAGVTTVLREGAIRFAPHFYNTMDEMERVAHILARA